MQQIFIVRHGQTHDNAHKIVSGSGETDLSQLGITQAKTAGQHAKQFKFDLIVASPLGRAQKTAHIIAEEIGYPVAHIQTMPDLAERYLGELQGLSYAGNDQLNGNFPAVDHIYGVEKLSNFHARIQHALRQLLEDKKHKTILVVCHLGVGRMLKTVAQGQPPQAMYNQSRLENATIYAL